MTDSFEKMLKDMEEQNISPKELLARVDRLVTDVPEVPGTGPASEKLVQEERNWLAYALQTGQGQAEDQSAKDYLARDPNMIIRRGEMQARVKDIYLPDVLQDILEKDLFTTDPSVGDTLQMLYNAKKHFKQEDAAGRQEDTAGRYDFALEPIVERFGEKAAMTTVKLMPEMFSAQVQEKYLGE